jgi:hypothetical protein
MQNIQNSNLVGRKLAEDIRAFIRLFNHTRAKFPTQQKIVKILLNEAEKLSMV